MEKQKLILIKDFLFKVFFIGLFFAVLLFVITTHFWHIWSSFIFTKFQVPEKELGVLVVQSFLILRFYLIFVILTPAIALHCLAKTK